MVEQVLTSLIRDVKDFPKPGIVFKDITPILADPGAMNQVYDALVAPYRDAGVTKIVGIESRGFIFGTPMADRLDVGFVPVRKPGKLPWKTVSESYALEYGEDTLELHEDGVGDALSLPVRVQVVLQIFRLIGPKRVLFGWPCTTVGKSPAGPWNRLPASRAEGRR